MLLNLKCPVCGHSQRASEAIFGKILLCSSCGGSFRVTGPKPGAAAPPAPRESPDRPAAIAANAHRSPPRSRSATAPAQRFDPPRLSAPPRAEGAGRADLPPWVYAALGVAAALSLVSMVILVRSLGGSGTGGPSHPADAGTPSASIVGPKPAPGAAGPSAVDATEGAPLSTAQIVARCEPSVALVKGKASSGTGFLIRRGLVATNAHVIDHEFLSDLEVRFPSAPAGLKGPSRAELLYEDKRRDLAFLAVESGLRPLDIAPTYRFVKGEDIIVIGNPGLGDEIVLENAISRGVMSSKAVLEGLNYLQLSIAINPGNSGGPVFDSAGRVIGVATLKSTKAEALAFCIPIKDVHAGLARLDGQPESARAAMASRHRAHLAFRLLTTAGALYSVGLNIRAVALQANRGAGPGVSRSPDEESQKLQEVLAMLEHRQFSLVDSQLPLIRTDASLSQVARRTYEELSANYKAMRDLYAHPSQPADRYVSRAQDLKVQHLRLVRSLGSDLGVEVPPKLLAILESSPAVAQPPVLFADVVPPPMQPRLRGFPGQFPRGPGGPGSPGGFDPGAEARARMQEIQDRLQQQMREAQERARGHRPRFGP
jgi:S1-C subfamily serine protease